MEEQIHTSPHWRSFQPTRPPEMPPAASGQNVWDEKRLTVYQRAAISFQAENRMNADYIVIVPLSFIIVLLMEIVFMGKERTVSCL